MTREEIDQAIQQWSEYYGVEFTAEAGNALAKVILARNEELQRRVDELEARGNKLERLYSLMKKMPGLRLDRQRSKADNEGH